jgi:PAS domain S-box-containing protein
MKKMKKILVIEDDNALRKNIVLFLSEEGYEVSQASDGMEGIQLALDIIPDLIICDVLLPRKDGFEVCKTLQNLSVTSTIPFIFLTAKVQYDNIREGMLYGADDYITKPFHIEDLLKSVQLRLEKQERLYSKTGISIENIISNPTAGMFMIVDNQIIYPNNKICNLTGFSLHEIKSMPFTQIIHNETSEKSIEKINRWLNNMYSSISLEICLASKHNSIRSVDFYGTKINYKGKDMHMVTIIEGKRMQDNSTEENVIKLTQREKDVLLLICKGYTSLEIAAKLNICKNTVNSHRAKLLHKTQSKNPAELVKIALEKNLV